MACSLVYKELAFNDALLDVWYLTQYVSIFQFLWGFVFCPLLVLPGFSSAEGLPMKTIWKNFEDGFKCFLYLDAKPSPCEARHTLWLLLGYCANNFAFK